MARAVSQSVERVEQMLSDPLYLGAVTSAIDPTEALTGEITPVIAFHRTSQGDGSSKYVGAWPSSTDKLLLTVSHSETNENKPYKTQRVSVRLDRLVQTADAQGTIVKASAYGVAVQPMASEVAAGEMQSLIRTLGLALLAGASTSSTDWTSSITDNDLVDRLLNGEA